MAIPASVEQWLRDHEVPYESVAADPLATGITVRSALLQQGERQLQVIYPADCLLDLGAVCRHTGRQWRAVTPAVLAQLCQRHGLQQLPGLPAAPELGVLVDRRLSDTAELSLASGAGDLLRLSAAQFHRGLGGATMADVAIPLAALAPGPLEQVDDIEAITHAVASFTQLRIRQRLEETLEIAPLPASAERIIRLRSDPYADTRQLTEIVEMDPGLAAQVVGWAASPYYAAPGQVRSVHDAIARVLGFEMVMNLALGLSLGRTVALPADWPAGFTAYWQQAIYTATAIEALIGAIPPARRPAVGLGYLTGLLHNFGLLVLAEFFPPHFSAYCRYQEANPTLGYAPIERHLLGVTRDQLAGWLMRLWSMPEEVATGLRHQDDPSYTGPHHLYPNLALVAKRLLRLHEIGDGPFAPVPDEVYDRLHLDPQRALQAVQHVVDASDDIRKLATGLGGA